MGQHYTLLINCELSDEYIKLLADRMIENSFAKEWRIINSENYRTILIEAKDIIWHKFEEELQFIKQKKRYLFDENYSTPFQILIRGKEDDFLFYSYKFEDKKLIKEI